MTRTLAIIALVASAGAAHAQTIGIAFDIDQPVLAPGESTTVTLAARFDDADYAVAGLGLDLLFDSPIADPRRHWSDLQLVPPFDGPDPGVGTPTDTAIEGIIAGQLNFPPAMIFADPTNPIAFWRGTFTAPLDAGRFYEVDLLTEVSRFDVYINRDSSTSESRLDVLVEGEATISVVPVPAGIGALALGMAAALTHRRRPR